MFIVFGEFYKNNTNSKNKLSKKTNAIRTLVTVNPTAQEWPGLPSNGPTQVLGK